MYRCINCLFYKIYTLTEVSVIICIYNIKEIHTILKKNFKVKSTYVLGGSSLLKQIKESQVLLVIENQHLTLNEDQLEQNFVCNTNIQICN